MDTLHNVLRSIRGETKARRAPPRRAAARDQGGERRGKARP